MGQSEGARARLAAELRAAGLAAGLYWIEGVHEPVPRPTDYLYLRRTPAPSGPAERWETGAFERGRWEPVAWHADEVTGCVHLRRLLLGGG